MDDNTLRQIIADILEGNTEKFEKIMQLYQKPIFLYCYHMLGNYAEAEDSGQEVFLNAFRSLNKYNPAIPFGTWLYKIAYNQCIDVIRKRKLAKYLPFFYQDEKENKHVDLQIEANYFDEYIQQAMSKLSAEERNLLILRCVEDKSYEEISLILNQNNATLRKKYERSAAKFRKHYAQVKGVKPYDIGQGSGFKRTFS
ncbi:sigma-70 family RNA polymerase sigma factor [Aneurinibacillus thermoaerophilus]|uniref:RNA polymerase sigma-70 factor, ECF subfamily n=1 Tax=Aneurinibacillus thermoaerophilus TaxID=143495 RepID=A0A1G8D929_ANETH|nr:MULTISPECIES: sigma-70 family RNA polymerase sigma factor [Aneurinibacillus]AMA72011.1 RNA polymerase [Aneurinibacillus sp. XH2]MED0677027.1 sigma-70 family RNA polymerase sigma factor [Aneurinibacillus thermoaerophilus]MED0679293.1 sigma-70 family RNA polymerase sigma factor [Aneurinibacillus thermoaerophilus]MED0737179.1 sigma-70 family RNA polymerase sigma factor [Aneurinibacillus thermoaerophilus]MED0757225.1 sigma-70 family RNA polymerase sigma factor [Aneurinibacillus thermoaerophilus